MKVNQQNILIGVVALGVLFFLFKGNGNGKCNCQETGECNCPEGECNCPNCPKNGLN